MKRERFARLGWYGMLAVVLAVLAVASYGYRNRLELERIDALNASREAMAVTSAAPVSTPAPTPEPPAYVWPVEGEIIGAFSPDAPLWSDTLNQWQTHAGVDIAAALGETVYACADGAVEDIWQDALWGNVIVLRHEDGARSTYANLEAMNLVSVGDLVSAGQPISTVGRSATCESEMADHLHFELNKDGKAVDFHSIMTKNS